MQITFDRQTTERTCPECQSSFRVVRGSVFDGGKPIGLYLLGLHGHSPEGTLAHLAVAMLVPGHDQPHAAAILVTATDDQFQFCFTDWAHSPWAEEYYLGRQLDREAVLSSQLRSKFLHVAEHIVTALPECGDYFGAADAP